MRTLWERRFFVKDEQAIREFAESIDDWNPLHHNRQAAFAAGLDGIIAPFVMTLGFVSSAIASELPGVRIHNLKVDFVQPIYAGMMPTVTVTVLKVKKNVAKASIKICQAHYVLVEGSCTLVLPKMQTAIAA